MKAVDVTSCQIQSYSGTLISLHVEVLSRILMHVDNSDIAAVMLTCKTLQSVIMTRQFWYHRIDRLCKEHLVSPPEEELESYTIAELEQWTLRRIRVRSSLPMKLQLRSRDTKLPLVSNATVRLIPGGRWLLVATHADFRIYFFDLDSNNLEQRLLVDPRHVDPYIDQGPALDDHTTSDLEQRLLLDPEDVLIIDGGPTLDDHTSICIDYKATRLSFRCAIFFVDEWDNGLHPSRVHIYQVNLIGHGAGATLVAQIMATFRTHAITSSCTLNDRYFVQGKGFNDNAKVEIYDYRQGFGCLDYPPIECHASPLGFHPSGMEFINEDVFIVRSWDSYHIFNVESPTSIIRLHTIKAYPSWLPHSRTCWTPEASIIAQINYDRRDDVTTIHGLVLPHNRTLNPWFIELGRFTQRYHTCLVKLGVFISMYCNQADNIVSHISHEWDFMSQSSDPIDVTVLERGVDEPDGLLTFDEDTGRSIHFSGPKFNVIDIAMAR